MAIQDNQRALHGLFSGIYDARFLPAELDLNDFVETVAEEEASDIRVASRIEEKNVIAPTSTTQRPLTRDESLAVDRKMQSLLESITLVKDRIRNIKIEIDKQGSPSEGKELQFNIDVSKRPTLKRAIRRSFGVNFGVITYSMYKEAIQMRAQLERDDAGSYVQGDDL